MTCGEIMKRLDSTSSMTELQTLSSDPVVRRHSAGCPACRRQFAGAERLSQGLEIWARLAESLPEEAVEGVRQRTLAAIRSGRRQNQG